MKWAEPMKSNEVKRAFTLVELLVVISIIAMLLAVLMPSLQKARDQAKIVVCKNNLRQVGLAFVLYAGSNNDRICPQAEYATIGSVNWDSADGETTHRTSWPFRLATYLGDKNYKYEPDPQKNIIGSHPYICPAQVEIKKMKYYKISYGTNYGTLFRYQYADMNKNPMDSRWVGPTRLGQIRNPSGLMAIMDSAAVVWPEYPISLIYSAYQTTGKGYGWAFIKDINKNGILDSYDRDHHFNGAGFRHDKGKKINATFADGHSETLSESEWAKRENWDVKY